VLGASNIIALIMEAASTFETLVNLCLTIRCNQPEGSYLHVHHRKNLKCHRKYPVNIVLFLEVFLIQYGPV
jgi:hypothetical protein